MSLLRVGFQGVKGAFGEEALYNYFGEEVHTIAVKNFEDICTSLESGTIEYGVLPIENSSTGAISDVYDLINKYECHIVGETHVKVNHNLMGIKGCKMEDIEEVYSHPQAFEQSKNYLNNYKWKLVPYYNTAKSAEYIMKQGNKKIAAIGSKKAAQLYNLDILASNINSNNTNTTRFIILGKKLMVNEDCNKISVVLSTEHKAGALYHVLKHFAENNINMLKIESRPRGNTPWEYNFYIDFEGNINNDIIRKALEKMSKDCHHFKILGNYKQFN
ncbi:prephenate dehydratase [Vallitalea guaymasensis]|uniref:Prephenate dehydratase n=1 Tax=Vallitalea guaymasensis TaxID=1185412 RepID=A0A8J8SCP8_9FIRM|nr:prephenate dehydratase [Vallitalea guaymasensis]QUH29666.1 prephenate dehydratase [Vallitalea guaymasensis]